MSKPAGRGMMAGAVFALVVAIFEVVSLMRYIARLPDDSLGIWMHSITIILWVIIALVFLILSRRRRPPE